GNIERGCAGFDDRIEHLAEEFGVGTRGVFGGKFYVGAERFGEGDGFAGVGEALLARDAEFVVQVNVGSGEEDVNARVGGVLQGFPGALDIGAAGAGEARDDGAADDGGDGLHGLKVAVGGDGESGFDHVDTETVELMGHAQLFLVVHAATGRLFSVAQGGVENGNADLWGHGSPSRK